MRYAQIDGAGVVVGMSVLAGEVVASHMIPLNDEQGNVMGMRWDGVTFIPVIPPQKPRLRITASQTRIWEATPGQAPSSDQVAILTGQLLDATGNPDPSATLPETLIDLPSPDGGTVLMVVRAIAGVLEVQTRQGWSQELPFATEHSGRYDIAGLLRPYFDVAEAPIIEVLRG